MSDQSSEFRPRDFAVLLLASGETAPRRRARDQQADRAGLLLKQRLLIALRDADPDIADLEPCLEKIVNDLGNPTGPSRAIARSIVDEWRLFQTNPTWAAHLLDEGIQMSARRRGEEKN